MKQFEFKIVNVGSPMGYQHTTKKMSLSEVLNELGQEGWSVAGVIPSGGEFGRQSDTDIILQREVVASMVCTECDMVADHCTCEQ